MPTLFFMRHAESEANKAKYLASQTDVPITVEGSKAAAEIADDFLKDYSIDAIYTSPQLRARQTSKPFSRISILDIIIDPALSEQHLGRFTGMTYKEAREDPHFQSDNTKRWNWQPEGGGEFYKDMADRIIPFFKKLNREGNYLIVTHAIAMRVIRGFLENTLPAYPSPIANNGEIWKVEYERPGKPHVIESLYYGNSASMVHKP